MLTPTQLCALDRASVRHSKLTKRAAFDGETEKAAPNRRRRVLGGRAPQWPLPERGVFCKYRPILRVRAVPPLTRRRRELEANSFGSSNRTRTRDLSVNGDCGIF
jgi:hypothetical protein